MIRDFSLKVKALTEAGSFMGYAATYDTVDLQQDSIQRGAFNQAVNSQPAEGYVLLWSHKQDEPVGTAKIEDSRTGLIVKGQLDLEDPDGLRAYRRVKKGIIRALSIGYTVDDSKMIFRDGVRYIKELMLHELSLVSVGAQQGAVISSVKSLSDVQTLLHGLDVSTIGPDVLRELKEIHIAVKALVERDGAEARDDVLLRELRQLATELK